MMEYAPMFIPISLLTPTPLPGHQAPLDKRHRWFYRSTDKAGNFWYRCSVCRRRKRVRPVVSLIAERMRDAERSIQDHLAETLFRP